MAKVEVGSQLKWQGKPVVCTSIYTLNETMYAPRSSQEMRLDMHEPTNVKIVTEEWDEFEEGDVITLQSQRVQLTELGRNLYFVFPYIKVKKEKLDGGEKKEDNLRTDGANHGEGSVRGSDSQSSNETVPT